MLQASFLQALAQTRCRRPMLTALPVLLLLLTGCMVGPDYVRPPVPVANEWIEKDNPELLQTPPDDAQWWTVFNDPVLDELVRTAYEQNLSLREAGLRVMEARALRAVAAGNLFPQSQQMFGQYARNETSLNGSPVTRSIPAGVFDRSHDFWSTGFDAAWELDFWGRFRRAIQAADADLDASVENYDAVLVTLVAEVAATYVQVRTFQQRLELARQNVEIQRGSLKLADVRFRAGAVTDLDVQQARSNLGQTEALIPQFEQGVRQSQNALCVLLGIPPQDLTEVLGGSRPIPTAPSQVAVGLPAELLRQRPDVRQAERRVAAQSARIGVAVSDLYPRFAITGTIGVEATEFNELFTSRSFTGSIGPGFTWNILNYGRLRNRIRVERARFDQLVVNYQNTVLQANEETESAIVAFFREQTRAQALARAVGAAKKSVDLVMTQYRDGAVDFNRVFNLQELLVRQQEALAQSQGAIAQNLIAVYKALGGGWQIRCANLAPPVANLPEVEAAPAPPAAPAAPGPTPPAAAAPAARTDLIAPLPPSV